MEMRRIKMWMLLVPVIGIMALCGCETSDNPDTDGVESYFDNNPTAQTSSHGDLPTAVELTVTASPSTLSSDGDKAVVSVSDGYAPYSWSVNDINLGNINSTSGDSVIYTRMNAGDNGLTVSDSKGNVGNVVITQ